MMGEERNSVVGGQSGVFAGAEQLFEIAGLVDTDLKHPVGVLGVAVDLFGISFQTLVSFEDLAVDRGN